MLKSFLKIQHVFDKNCTINSHFRTKKQVNMQAFHQKHVHLSLSISYFTSKVRTNSTASIQYSIKKLLFCNIQQKRSVIHLTEITFINYFPDATYGQLQQSATFRFHVMLSILHSVFHDNPAENLNR